MKKKKEVVAPQPSVEEPKRFLPEEVSDLLSKEVKNVRHQIKSFFKGESQLTDFIFEQLDAVDKVLNPIPEKKELVPFIAPQPDPVEIDPQDPAMPESFKMYLEGLSGIDAEQFWIWVDGHPRIEDDILNIIAKKISG